MGANRFRSITRVSVKFCTQLISLQIILFGLGSHTALGSQNTNDDKLQAERGLNYLLGRDFNQSTLDADEFNNLYLVWPSYIRDRAAVDLNFRKAESYKRYGFHERDKNDPNYGVPLGWIPQKNNSNKWKANCLVCHAGPVPVSPTEYRIMIGAPNTQINLGTFFEDRILFYKKFPKLVKRSIKDRIEHKMTLGLYENIMLAKGGFLTRGTPDALLFTAVGFALRDEDMSQKYFKMGGLVFKAYPDIFGMWSADADVPAWWNTRYKTRLFHDGFAPVDARSLIATDVVPNVKVREMEPIFESIKAYIGTIESPRYPGVINRELAARGRETFVKHCASCHGHYDNGIVEHVTKSVDIQSVDTDSTRLRAMTKEYRLFVSQSWIGRNFESDFDINPRGYTAPPLNGVWASAPYLHNGSVPTLYHMIYPDKRPAVWRRLDGYDFNYIGLNIEDLSSGAREVSGDVLATSEVLAADNVLAADEVSGRSTHQDSEAGHRSPTILKSKVEQATEVLRRQEAREVMDTLIDSKSNKGHLYPNKIETDQEKAALLEYLKTI